MTVWINLDIANTVGEADAFYVNSSPVAGGEVDLRSFVFAARHRRKGECKDKAEG